MELYTSGVTSYMTARGLPHIRLITALLWSVITVQEEKGQKCEPSLG